MTLQNPPDRRALGAGLVVLLITLLVMAAAGCGTKAKESASADKAKSGSSKSVVVKFTTWTNGAWKKLTSTFTAKSTKSKSTESKGTEPSVTPKATASRTTVPKHTVSKRTASRSTASRRTVSKSSRSRVAAHHAGARKARAKSAAAASAGRHIRLVQKGCIEFDPPWTTIRVGQALTWHSHLKRKITIHVSAGAFPRTAYVVTAGGSVSTGPARKPGSYSMWSRPASCQGTPRGVHGGGPGVTIARRRG